ncbi:hypothetical protein V8F20_004424 [Naviculisporaceae sp. PSN 640]
MAAVDVLPTYEQATRSRSSTASPIVEENDTTEHNGIPLRTRRSMEDELRPLPDRWVRTFDPATQHQFFVDTVSSPTRAIWHHPYDDDVYMSTLSQNERDSINASFPNNPYAEPDETRDIVPNGDAHTSKHGNQSLPSRPTQDYDHHRSLGRKLKDTLTGHLHRGRNQDTTIPNPTYPGNANPSEQKLQRDASHSTPSSSEQNSHESEEREMHRQHLLLRRGMSAAMNTSKPQLLGRDQNGTNVYLEPPGHMFPGVDTSRVKPLSPYLNEVFYEHDPSNQDGDFPGPEGRYLRPRGEMYGFAYGGYDCGAWGGGRWPKPGGEPKDGRRRMGARKDHTHEHDGNGGLGSGFKGGMALPMMTPAFGGLILGSLMF